MHDVDIYEFLVTQGGRKLMPNTQLNSIISFIPHQQQEMKIK